MVPVALILSVWFGGIAGWRLSTYFKYSKELLIISAGFLISITVGELLPEVYEGDEHHNIGLFILGGVLLQMILESFTKGFEHGHVHHHPEKMLPWGLAIGLFIHAFLEGFPLAHEEHLDSPYLMGILVHNLPISFIMGAFFLRAEKNIIRMWVIFSLFSLASPLGILVGKYLPMNIQHISLAIVSGIFLHISSVIIFESNQHHKMDWKKLFLVVLGMALALVSHLFHHHEH